MYKKPFETLLYNMQTTKSDLKDFLKDIKDDNFHIDIHQLRLIIQCFEYNTDAAKAIKAKIKFFESFYVMCV